MKSALKWGIAGAAGIAVALAIKNISDENEETEQKAQLALQQFVESSQIVKSYGTWRSVKETGSPDYWRLEAPQNIEGKTLISWYIETDNEDEAYAISPYRVNDNFGAFVLRGASKLPVNLNLRVVGLWL